MVTIFNARVLFQSFKHQLCSHLLCCIYFLFESHPSCNALPFRAWLRLPDSLYSLLRNIRVREQHKDARKWLHVALSTGQAGRLGFKAGRLNSIFARVPSLYDRIPLDFISVAHRVWKCGLVEWQQHQLSNSSQCCNVRCKPSWLQCSAFSSLVAPSRLAVLLVTQYSSA